ncbi:hypothetical protein vseg_003296 [Gypsophila vaccaria]
MVEVLEPRVEEAEAMLEGLKEACSRRGHEDVVVGSDCQVLVDDVAGRKHGMTEFHAVLDDIFKPVTNFSHFKWSFVGSVWVAHELA